MSLVQCSDCGRNISRRATSCPHCGRPRGRRGFWRLAVALLAILGLMIVITALLGIQRSAQAPTQPNITSP
jgi:anti-sigma-K factor RskA